jgi:hypothetical protein
MNNNYLAILKIIVLATGLSIFVGQNQASQLTLNSPLNSLDKLSYLSISPRLIISFISLSSQQGMPLNLIGGASR